MQYGVDPCLRDVAQLVLQPRQLPDSIHERRVGRKRGVHLLPEPGLGLAAAGREDVLDQHLAADLEDRGRRPRRQPVVVGREEALCVWGDVVEMPRAPDAVPHGGPGHESRGVQGPKLLRHAAPARADGCRDRIRDGRADAAQVQQDRVARATWDTAVIAVVGVGV